MKELRCCLVYMIFWRLTIDERSLTTNNLSRVPDRFTVTLFKETYLVRVPSGFTFPPFAVGRSDMLKGAPESEPSKKPHAVMVVLFSPPSLVREVSSKSFFKWSL